MGKKGFGQSVASTWKEKDFMRSFLKHAIKAKGNKTRIQDFLKSNKAKLNESLLDALPLVFKAFLAGDFCDEREKVAQFFSIFGNTIQQFPLGDRMLNLELAIAAYELALQIYTREVFPQNWATTQNNLGAAYSDRLRGEPAENLEKAISNYELALQIWTREALPQDWATIQNNLGNAYSKRLRGERAENLEKAISNYELALQIWTREAFPQDWAITQNNLGTAYRDRLRGERAENLEKAISNYELALQVRTREAFPQDWAMTQNNIGNAYNDRLRGERAENLEKAISNYELALQVYTREAFPQGWAATKQNLGAAYYNRLRGERTENLEKAISNYELALQVYTCEAFPQDWAITKSNLAEALMAVALITDNPDELDTAITFLQSALEIASPGSPYFIDAQYCLGNALSRQYKNSHNPIDLQKSLQAYKIALDAISPEHYDRKEIWKALPTTQTILGSRLVRDGQWQEGLQLLLNSVNQLSTGDDFLSHANALFQTGHAYEALVDWDNARTYYRDALRWYEHLNDLPGIAKSCAALGGVLVSQGHFQKGMAELLKASKSFHQLEKFTKAAEADSLYASAQRVIERQVAEVSV
jgi:tetratricopeptide (TPR) repeat protein